MLRAVNTPKEALIISAVGLATTAFTGFSILRALKARRWERISASVCVEWPTPAPKKLSRSLVNSWPPAA